MLLLAPSPPCPVLSVLPASEAPPPPPPGSGLLDEPAPPAYPSTGVKPPALPLAPEVS